jgi:hypothetical protein
LMVPRFVERMVGSSKHSTETPVNDEEKEEVTGEHVVLEAKEKRPSSTT